MCEGLNCTGGYSLSVAQNLAVAVLEGVDHGNDLGALRESLLLLRGHKRPELVDVDDGAPLEVAGEVEATHTNLTEVTGMVLIEVRPVCGVSSKSSKDPCAFACSHRMQFEGIQ